MVVCSLVLTLLAVVVGLAKVQTSACIAARYAIERASRPPSGRSSGWIELVAAAGLVRWHLCRA